MKLLIIPDAHAHYQWGNERFDWLGRFIIDERPDRILCLGDFSDLPSLSSYDRGTKGYEGRRYKLDVEVTVDAQERLFAPMKAHNAERRRLKEKQYKPKTDMLLGNHEHRIDRATNASPELDQTIGVEDLKYSEYWDRVWDFNQTVVIEGFACSHYFPSGTKGLPTSGVNAARTLLNKQHQSCIAGHAHELKTAEDARADGTKLLGLVAGCYTHPDYIESWCASTVHLWWRGVVMLEGVKDGYYEEKREITQASLRKRYT